MKNTQRHEVGLVLIKINMMSNHDKKKTLYAVDNYAKFFSLHTKSKIM